MTFAAFMPPQSFLFIFADFHALDSVFLTTRVVWGDDDNMTMNFDEYIAKFYRRVVSTRTGHQCKKIGRRVCRKLNCKKDAKLSS